MGPMLTIGEVVVKESRIYGSYYIIVNYDNS